MHYKVYLILAHKNPNQLKDLISLLQDELSIFFIHIDKKVDVNSFKEVIFNTNCFFVKNREKCKWGDFSLVKATLNSFEEICKYMQKKFPLDSYHCIMLSGEDLPLKTNEEITLFLQNCEHTSYIHHWELPYDKWWKGGFFRFESLYLLSFVKYQRINNWVNRLIKKLNLDFLLPINKIKKAYPNFKFYGSTQWIILSKDIIFDILQISKTNKKFISCFKYTLAPDELYFSSLIYNFELDRKFKIENVPTHLVKFEGTNPNPQYLTVDEIKTNVKRSILFARKFDNFQNIETIIYIKENLLK